MGLSDDTFFMIEHTPWPNGNHPISSPICPMGVADTLGFEALDHNLSRSYDDMLISNNCKRWLMPKLIKKNLVCYLILTYQGLCCAIGPLDD